MSLRSIRGRIALLTGGITALIFAGLGIFLYASLETQLQQALDEALQVSAAQLLAIVEYEDGQWRFDEGDTDTGEGVDDVSRIVSPTGIILDDRSHEYALLPPASLSGSGGLFSVPMRDDDEDEDEPESALADEADDLLRLLSVPVIRDNQIVAYLQVGRSLETIQQTLSRLLTLLLLSGPILTVVGAGAGYWLAGQTLAPIEAIRRRAASISAQDLDARLDFPLPDDEVGRLAQTFNEMLARLDESFRRQRRFTADASHELRTPLSVIRGEVDVTLEQPRTSEEYQRTLRVIGAETEWMSRLVNDLLLLARSDAAEFVLEKHPIDLADLLTVLTEQMATQAEAAGVSLQVDLPQPLLVHADPDRLLQVFINLFQNAFTYAPHSRVSVNGRRADTFVEITVADTGPGIAAEHLPHIFDRFYRVDKARSRSQGTSGGSGLGLAIAQEIIQAHSGGLDVESQLEQGTNFIVRLPHSQ